MRDLKQCSRCTEWFPRTAEFFQRRSGRPDGLIGWCKSCSSDYRKQLLESKPHLRIRHVASRYGITDVDYYKMLEEQGGRCRICRRPPLGTGRHKVLTIDHDHDTGAIRGLLCGQCNTGLGNFWDSSELMLRAVRYLEGKKLDPEWKSPSQQKRMT